MTDSATTSKVYASALGLLARREHSFQELQQKLLQRFPDSRPVIAQVLEKLVEEDRQSDARFVESYLRSRLAKGFGSQRLRQELRVRGVDINLVEKVMASMVGQGESLSRIHHVWKKKFGSPPDNPKEKVRHINFLRYRGFSTEEIHVLFSHLEQQESFV